MNRTTAQPAAARGAGAPAPSPAEAAESLVREPQQDRSRRTLERILGAGLHLLEAEGPDALTVTGITRRARTSVGSFYARFEGKDDLLRYMGERALEEALGEWARVGEAPAPGNARVAEGPGGGLRVTVETLVEALADLHLEGPGRTLALLNGLEDPAPSRTRRLDAALAEGLVDLLHIPGVRAELAARAVTGLLRDAVLLGDTADARGSDGALGRRVLRAELVELLVGYLGGAVRAPPETATPEGRRLEAAPEAEFEPVSDELFDEAFEAAFETVVEPAAEAASASSPEPAPPPAEPEPSSPSPPESEPSTTPGTEPDPFDVWG